jgi:hypothetical protein
MRASRRALLAGGAALLLAACGGSGDDGSPPDSGGSYLPLGDGNRWLYSDGSQVQLARASGGGAPAPWIWIETVGGAPFGQYVQSDADGVRFSSAGGANFPAYTQTVLRAPVTTGDRYPSLRVVFSFADMDHDGTLDDTETIADAEVVGFETVVTPAGRFDGAVHVRFSKRIDLVFQPAGRRVTAQTGTLDEWYAPGVGRVKSVETITSSNSTDTTRRELTGYRVGSRTGGVLR